MASDGRWSEPGTDPREGLAPGRGERAVLAQYLDHYRLTLELKCEGLTAEQLATRAVPPSTLSLLGLVRHLARVEHSWWRRVVEGHARRCPASTAPTTDPDLDFDGACPMTRSSPTPGTPGTPRSSTPARSTPASTSTRLVRVHDEDVEARDIVVHLVEEYARHLGHADLLRECIDGRTGQ